MSKSLTFHVLILPAGSWGEVRRRFLHVEELGLDAAGMGDHFVDWTNPPRPWFEMWSVLSAIAADTSDIRLQTSVAQIPFRNPALLARQALTVDHISGGRLELGLGTGLTSDPSYEMMGSPNWEARERVARFGEYVQIVDQLLSNELTTFKGEYYNVEGAYMNPRPVQQPRPPITIAALGPKMMRHAAQYADIWDSLSFAADIETQIAETQQRIEVIDSLCNELGRDPRTLEHSYLMFDANSRASGGSINYYDSTDLFEHIVEQAVQMGISSIGMYYPTIADQVASFEAIATHTIPKLKQALTSDT